MAQENDWRTSSENARCSQTDALYRDYEVVKVTLASERTMQILRRR